jgi:hypothetical protein
VSANPFATEEAWEAGDSILVARPEPYLVDILEAEQGTSSGGYPEIVVKTGNEEGQITDWIVVTDATVGKVLMLTEAAGLDRPTDEQVSKVDKGWALDPKYVQQLIGKKVGVKVRAEKDQRDPTKTRDRVAGYVPADKASATPAPSGAPAADDDIPF